MSKFKRIATSTVSPASSPYAQPDPDSFSRASQGNPSPSTVRVPGCQRARRHARRRPLTGLSGLTSFPGTLYVSNNAALTSLSGLDNVQATSSLNVTGNPLLTTLGLGALDAVTSQFIVQNNPMLSLCEITALHDGLSQQPALSSFTTGNLDDTPCM